MPTDPLPKESDTLITMPYKRRPYIRRRPYRRRIPKDTLVTMPKYRYVKPKPKPWPKPCIVSWEWPSNVAQAM